MEEQLKELEQLANELNELLEERERTRERIKTLVPLVDSAQRVRDELSQQLTVEHGDAAVIEERIRELRHDLESLRTEFTDEIADATRQFDEDAADLSTRLDEATKPE